jgi:hypothetical protein
MMQERPPWQRELSPWRVLAVLATLLLLPPFLALAVLPMAIMLLPVAVVALPFMIPALLSASLAKEPVAPARRRRLRMVPRAATVLLALAFTACGSTVAPLNLSPSQSGISNAAGSSGLVAGAPSSPAAAMRSTCSSGAFWQQGESESPLMHPGGTCINCHSRGEGPAFSIAGTVYPTAHEPNDCDGVDGANDVRVVITDAAGSVLTLSVNAAGNFSSRQRVMYPFSAKVVTASQERAMAELQNSGDCNSCHTENGANNAPGRIMLP